MRVMSKDVTIQRFSTISNRTFMLTLQYTFKATRDRYRGQGAGKNELNRFDPNRKLAPAMAGRQKKTAAWIPGGCLCVCS